MSEDNLVCLPSHGLDLRVTAGPVAWGKGRWPAHEWMQDALIYCIRDDDGPQIVRVSQASPETITVSGLERSAAECFLSSHLGWGQRIPDLDEPVVAGLLASYPGLRPWAHGSLGEGVIFSIVGQSISVQAAAVTERRLSAMFTPPVEVDGRAFYPFPRIDDLADSDAARIRESGVTWRRAEAIVAIARIVADGQLIDDATAAADYDAALEHLRQLPLVGPWTAASALLWGIGAGDAHPSGDVALLRAARQAFAQPDMTLKQLDQLAESWRPGRGWAARALWTMLLGIAG